MISLYIPWYFFYCPEKKSLTDTSKNVFYSNSYNFTFSISIPVSVCGKAGNIR
jgi:hypothetical protein